MKTYAWQDAITLAKHMTKGAPLNTVDSLICDMVNSTIWKAYPWYDSLSNIAAGTIPLVDKVQDYSCPPNVYRLTELRIVRTDVTPNYHRDIDVRKDMSVNLTPCAPETVRCGCLQADTGLIRLETAVRVTAPSTYEIQGQYQTHPAKISALTDGMWMHDEHLEVAAKGVLYWAYRNGDDPRAGEEQVTSGRKAYTGQLAAFMGAIEEMAAAEDFGSIEGYSPSETIGSDERRYHSFWNR